MDRIPMYRYLGTNGVITSPVHLEDIYYVNMVKLVADPDKILTDGTVREATVTVGADEEDRWYEIPRA